MRPTTLSISLLLSWLLICCAQDVAQDQADALTSSIQGPGHGEQNVLRTEQAHQDVVPDGTEDVTHAIKILGQIQPAKHSLVRHSRKSGIVGTALGYASTIFDLLFVHTPSQLDFTATAPASKPAKLSHNLARAVRLLEQAAVKYDHPDALWLLGELHFHGNYTHPRNFPAAFQYYERLARLNGNASAQYMVGFMYATGIGGSVPRDQAKALLYHTFAADQGDTRSQMTVAYRHHAGIGTPRNCELAVKYYSQVAKKAVAFYKSGPPGGHVLTKNAYRIADETGGFYGEGASVVSAGPNARTAGPTSDAYAKIEDVLDYLDLKSRNGELTSTFNLAKLYYDGSRGLDRDLVQARALFVKILRQYWEPDGTPRTDPSSVAKKLAPRAAGFLGRMFLRGEATKVNYDNAMKWFKRGIEHGDVLSQYSMGVMYMYGLGVPPDPVKAASYLSAAADSNMAVAQTDLGVLFLDQGDIETARLYFELATASGHIEAYYYLAEIAEKGLGRERSCGIAASAYKVTSEIAEVVSASFIEANEAYDEGDTQKAVVAYMMAAEQGYENAQANVAWLLDQTHAQYGVQAVLSHILPFVKQSAISATDAALSLIYYTRSARQRNWDSLVKAGDYYISGLGIHNITSSEPLADSFTTDDTPPSSSPPALLHPNPENAAACYQAAAEHMKSGQAMWNLGWMHESGIGVEQDFHLAKRYYDLALATDREAYLTVTLSLYKLRLRSWWNDVSHGGVRPIGPDEPQADNRPKGFWDFIKRFLEADARRDELEEEEWAEQRAQDRRERGQDPDAGDGVPEEYLEEELGEVLMESLTILVLVALLGGMIWWRNRVQRAGPQPPRPQVFPAPDDPDFAPWNNPVGAGGVGQ